MNFIHYLLIAAVLVYILLWFVAPRHGRTANRYLAGVFLVIAAALVLTPFIWLFCSVFKDKSVLMQYSFLPPLETWFKISELKEKALADNIEPSVLQSVWEWFADVLKNENMQKSILLPLKEWGNALNFGNFIELFSGDESPQGKVYFWQYIVNSIFLSCAGTTIGLFLTSLSGYALSKYQFKGRNILIFFMVGSMMFPPMLFLGPLYQMIYKLNWMDTYLALLVPGACAVFGIFLFRQAMQGIPNSLIEAARMDGAGEFQIYWNVIMPLVRPMTGAYCLITFLGNWNNFLNPQIYINSTAKQTLPVILNQYIGVYAQQYGVFLAGTLLAIIPPAILFFALQKEFVAGLTSGATKG